MKKLKLLLLILISTCLISCDNNSDNPDENNHNKPILSDDEIFNDMSEKEVMNKIQEKISEKEKYYIETIGKTNTKVIFKYEQETQTKTFYSKDYVFTDISSNSFVVSRDHKVYSSQNNVSYYDSKESSDENDIIKKSKTDYLKDFGIIHSKENFFDFIINDNTITSINKGKIDDLYALELELKEEATANLKVQMKELGSLNSYPKFEKIILTIKFNKNFEVLSYDSYQEYSINIALLGTTNCTQNLSSTIKYDNYKEPNLEKYNDKPLNLSLAFGLL